jgi:hypothetical protein
MTGERVEPLTGDEIHSHVVEQPKKYESLSLLEGVRPAGMRMRQVEH